MRMMKNPSQVQVRDAIYDVGSGIMSDTWVNSAWDAMRIWIAGSLSTSPFRAGSPTPGTHTTLNVSWLWERGDLTVTVSRV